MAGDYWKGRSVLITGNTGFKGAWLSLWLRALGAVPTGYSLEAPTTPSLFELAQISAWMECVRGDVRDVDHLRSVVARCKPSVVFHMAAQSLVRESYRSPRLTFDVNVLGTANCLEACRGIDTIQSIVVVTSDKCYENRNWVWGYREVDPLGGSDPYSTSKACAELVAAAYRDAFFSGREDHAALVATVRAGNVIGGGDWAADRLVPDAVRSFSTGSSLRIRYPDSVRPWQHVLDPLQGYLLLAERMGDTNSERGRFVGAWNFGPDDASTVSVRVVAQKLADHWGERARWERESGDHPHESRALRLDSAKARAELGWRPRLHLDTALQWAVDWHRRQGAGENVASLVAAQIGLYRDMLGRT
jgi:CDP-glucose 4,6-dehydratase